LGPKIRKIDPDERQYFFKRMTYTYVAYDNIRQDADRLDLHPSWWWFSFKICGKMQNLRQVLQREPF